MHRRPLPRAGRRAVPGPGGARRPAERPGRRGPGPGGPDPGLRLGHDHRRRAGRRARRRPGTPAAPRPRPGGRLRAGGGQGRAEVERVAAACALADTALRALLDDGGLRPGRTEAQVARDLDDRMRHLGADGPAFDTILAAGPHSAIPHHRPTGSAARCAAATSSRSTSGRRWTATTPTPPARSVSARPRTGSASCTPWSTPRPSRAGPPSSTVPRSPPSTPPPVR